MLPPRLSDGRCAWPGPSPGRCSWPRSSVPRPTGAGVGLLATSSWLISRAAQHPAVGALGIAVVAVRFFAVSRGLFRYGERVVGHDAAFRELAGTRDEAVRSDSSGWPRPA